MMTKKQIRGLIHHQKQQLTPILIDDASKKISDTVVHSLEFQVASIIFLYAALPFEVQTRQIAEYALNQGKKIAFPKVFEIERQMDFYQVAAFEDLEEVSFKSFVLLEPRLDDSRKIIPTANDLMIVPGVAFDREKHRMGYGGGFYDKYLSKHRVCTMGVAMDFQILEQIPSESHDQILDCIVSDKRLI